MNRNKKLSDTEREIIEIRDQYKKLKEKHNYIRNREKKLSKQYHNIKNQSIEIRLSFFNFIVDELIPNYREIIEEYDLIVEKLYEFLKDLLPKEEGKLLE